MLARKLWAYGPGREYFDDAGCVGFTRLGLAEAEAEAGRDRDSADGNASKREGLAVIVNIGTGYAVKKMFVGTERRGQRFTDLLGFAWGEVEVDEEGWGVFPVGPRSVCVWLNSQAVGREKVEGLTRIPEMVYGK